MMAEAPLFDWPALLKLGLRHLRLSPEAFWALTPWELRLMLGAQAGAAGLDPAGLGRAGLDRRSLQQLMARFPDPAQGRAETHV